MLGQHYVTARRARPHEPIALPTISRRPLKPERKETDNACRAGDRRTGPRDRRRPVQVRLHHRHRDGQRAQGPERGHRPLHLGQEGRAGVDARVAAGGLSALADHARADLGARVTIRKIDYPGPLLLRRAQEEGGPEVARRDRSGDPGDLREARHSAARAGDPGRRAEPPTAIAVDAVFDSVSVVTTFKEELRRPA